MWRPRTIVERAQDVHEDGSEALSEARAASCGARFDAHLERIRYRSQVAVFRTRDLDPTQKKAKQGARRCWCRYAVAQTGDSRLQEQGYERRGG